MAPRWAPLGPTALRGAPGLPAVGKGPRSACCLTSLGTLASASLLQGAHCVPSLILETVLGAGHQTVVTVPGECGGSLRSLGAQDCPGLDVPLDQ